MSPIFISDFLVLCFNLFIIGGILIDCCGFIAVVPHFNVVPPPQFYSTSIAFRYMILGDACDVNIALTDSACLPYFFMILIVFPSIFRWTTGLGRQDSLERDASMKIFPLCRRIQWNVDPPDGNVRIVGVFTNWYHLFVIIQFYLRLGARLLFIIIMTPFQGPYSAHFALNINHEVQF